MYQFKFILAIDSSLVIVQHHRFQQNDNKPNTHISIFAFAFEYMFHILFILRWSIFRKLTKRYVQKVQNQQFLLHKDAWKLLFHTIFTFFVYCKPIFNYFFFFTSFVMMFSMSIFHLFPTCFVLKRIYKVLFLLTEELFHKQLQSEWSGDLL